MSSGLINRILKKLADITYPWPVGMVYPTSSYYATNYGGDINLQKASGKSILRRYMTKASWTGTGTTSNVWTKSTATSCAIEIHREPQYIYIRGTNVAIPSTNIGTVVSLGSLGTSIFPVLNNSWDSYGMGHADGGQCIFKVQSYYSSNEVNIRVTPTIKKDKTTTAVSFTDGQFSLFIYPNLTNLSASSHPISFAHITKTGLS